MRISDWSSDVCSSDLLLCAWPFGDPVARLRQHLEALGEWDAERHEAQRTELEELVKTTQKQSEKLGILGHGMHQPFETMFDDVFEELPWHLKEQCAQMLAEQEAKLGPNWKRSDEHTSELQSQLRISYAVPCLKKKYQRLRQHAKVTPNNEIN